MSQKHCVQMIAVVQGHVISSQVHVHAKSIVLAPTVLPCFALHLVSCVRHVHQMGVCDAEVDIISRGTQKCAVLAMISILDVLDVHLTKDVQCVLIHY